jgi:hypothetical protein
MRYLVVSKNKNVVDQILDIPQHIVDFYRFKRRYDDIMQYSAGGSHRLLDIWR